MKYGSVHNSGKSIVQYVAIPLHSVWCVAITYRALYGQWYSLVLCSVYVAALYGVVQFSSVQCNTVMWGALENRSVDVVLCSAVYCGAV